MALFRRFSTPLLTPLLAMCVWWYIVAPPVFAEAGPAQRDAFAAAFREAVRTGNAATLEPLLMHAGMSIADVAWNQQTLAPMLAALGRDPRALRFVWGPPAASLGTLQPGARFSLSCTPVTTLRVEVATQPGNAVVLPLCLEDGQLKRAGTIRAPKP